jgi:hypothetical protein
LLLALALGRSATGADVDRFEIQVYDAETAPPAAFGFELHLNTIASGTRADRAGELATDRLTHLTFEPHLGVARWAEVGAYLQTAYLPDGRILWGGFKLRGKVRVPHRLAHRLIGLALNVELSMVPARFETNVWGSEWRFILDLRWRRIYFALNPIITVDLAGVEAGKPQLEPALKLDVNLVKDLALGLEYYAAFGPVTDFAPVVGQVHQLYGVLDVSHRVSEKIDFGLNAGVGYNLTDRGDRIVVKLLLSLGR